MKSIFFGFVIVLLMGIIYELTGKRQEFLIPFCVLAAVIGLINGYDVIRLLFK